MVKKKEYWEDKKEIKTASISIKKTKACSISGELVALMDKYKDSFTQLYNEYLLEASGLKRNEFDDKVIDFIEKELCNIRGRANSRNVRKFLAKYYEKKTKDKQLKKRLIEYVEEEQYI